MADASGTGAGDAFPTALDRFPAAGISPEGFDGHLAGGRIAVTGQRITEPVRDVVGQALGPA